MRILITGGLGFIGTHAAAELRNGHEVLIADRQDGDLTQLGVAEDLLASTRPDVVLHCAAQVGRLFGEDDIARTVQSNALMSAYVARACAGHDARLAYVSTSEVYGDQHERVMEEAGPFVLPHNLYGLSKRWGEEATRLYAKEYQILRLFMPYGPGLPAGRGRAALVNMLWQAHHGKELLVHANSGRSWCWVGDTARGIRAVLEKGEVARGPEWDTGIRHDYACYNVGRSDNWVSMEHVAELACEIAGAPRSLIRIIKAPANQTTVKRCGTEKLEALGWAPKVHLLDGMREVYGWLKTLPGA